MICLVSASSFPEAFADVITPSVAMGEGGRSTLNRDTLTAFMSFGLAVLALGRSYYYTQRLSLSAISLCPPSQQEPNSERHDLIQEAPKP